MIKYVLFILVGLSLSLLETSFFASQQGIVRFTPFVFVLSVYLLQHHGMRSAIGWIMLHGLLVQLFSISSAPFILLAYLCGALVARVSAIKIFSNRSFYGVLACTLIGYTALVAVELILQGAETLFGREPFFPWIILSDLLWRYLMLCLFVIILFSLSKQIRSLMQKMFLPSVSRSTLS